MTCQCMAAPIPEMLIIGQTNKSQLATGPFCSMQAAIDP